MTVVECFSINLKTPLSTRLNSSGEEKGKERKKNPKTFLFHPPFPRLTIISIRYQRSAAEIYKLGPKSSECAYFPVPILIINMAHRDKYNDQINQGKHLWDESKRSRKKLFFKLRVRSEVVTTFLQFPAGRNAPSTDRSPWKYVNQPLSRPIIPRKSLPSMDGSRGFKSIFWNMHRVQILPLEKKELAKNFRDAYFL